MKLSYHWLQDYLDLPPAAEVGKLITTHVAEVESIHDQAASFEGIVVGKILEVKAHPNANKLRLCNVELGDVVHQIVCGGSNLEVNQLVVVAMPGAKVRWHGEGDLIELKETSIRGEGSYGMICAAIELGLEQLFPTKDEREIIDLSSSAQPSGTPLAQALKLNDIIIEIDNKTLTHRPDLFCHIGFARELSVILNQPLKLKALRAFSAGNALPYAVEVEATDRCRRYMGTVVQNVQIKPSPEWLQQRLFAIGLRPINNVVDITNYVMYEYGQPLHAFDYAKLTGNKVVVRLAKAGEFITTLDGKERTLPEGALLIADAEKGEAVAGIMGGQLSEVTDATTTVAIESANFEQTHIRMTAQALALRTDGSTRHEKNLPLGLPELGLWRALELLEELAGATVAAPIVDLQFASKPKPVITLNLDYVNRLIGVSVPASDIQRILEQLGCSIDMSNSETWQVTAPTHRVDLTIPDELIEEVARMYGYNAIPPQPLVAALEPSVTEPVLKLGKELVDQLVQTGAVEVINYSFYSESTAERFGLNKADHTSMLNPMNPDQALLRTSLLPNIVLTAEHNFETSRRTFTLVEYGHVYLNEGEQRHIAIASVGKTPEVFRTVKGYLEAARCPVNKASIRVLPLKDYFIAVAELNLADVSAMPLKAKSIAEFPGIELDISLEFPEMVAWSEIEPVVLQTSKLIESVTVFDTYKNSMGIRLMLRHGERTLAMDEADQVRNTIVDSLHKRFKTTLRT